MTERRALLRGLAALPLAGLAMPALASPVTATEPLVALRQRFVDLMAVYDGYKGTDLSDAESDAKEAAMDAAFDLRHDSLDLRATTPAGALASLEWAREEFARHYVECKKPDWMDVWTLAMIDSALGVLRVTVERGA